MEFDFNSPVSGEIDAIAYPCAKLHCEQYFTAELAKIAEINKG